MRSASFFGHRKAHPSDSGDQLLHRREKHVAAEKRRNEHSDERDNVEHQNFLCLTFKMSHGRSGPLALAPGWALLHGARTNRREQKRNAEGKNSSLLL